MKNDFLQPLPPFRIRETLEGAADRAERKEIVKQLARNLGVTNATILRRARQAGYTTNHEKGATQ